MVEDDNPSAIKIALEPLGNTFPSSEMFEAAAENNWDEVFNLIRSRARLFQDFTATNITSSKRDWNILIYACNIENDEESLKNVEAIFDIMQNYEYTASDLDQFLNHSDRNGDTALTISISKNNTDLVRKLIKHGADVDLGTGNTDVLYGKLHKIILDLFDEGFQLDRGSEPDNELLWNVECDFTPITGIATTRDEESFSLRETRLVATVLSKDKPKQSDIILHPIMQIFLYEKGKKFMWFFIVSFLYHITWAALTIDVIVNHTNMFALNGSKHANFSAYISRTYCQGLEVKPKFWLFVPIYLIAAGKIIFETMSCPSRLYYGKHIVNVAQGFLVISSPVAIILPLVTKDGDPICDTVYNNNCLIASLIVIQGQITRIYGIGVYNEMLITIFGRFVQVFVTFLPILTAFAVLFRVIFPQHDSFSLQWDLGLSKILTMLIGELEYNDTFYGDDGPSIPQPTASKILYVLFLISIVILLQNLLTALAVDDIMMLKRECEAKHFGTILETMYLMEYFVMSKVCRRCLLVTRLDALIPYLLLTGNRIGSTTNNPDSKREIHFRKLFIKLPENIQAAIKSKYPV